MATTGNNLPRKLNPETGEWEVDDSQLTTQPTATGGGTRPSRPTTFGAGSTTQPASGGTGTNPNAPVVYNAPQVAGSNMYNPNGDFVQGGVNPTTYASNVAASGTQTATPATTTTANPWDSLTGAARANNAGYIDSEINRAMQERYGRPATPEELDYWRKKATTPDTYTGGNIHQGWNPYLYDRAANPNSASGSSVNPGTDTIIGYNNGPSPWGSATQAPMLLPMMNQTASAPASSAPAGPEPLMNISQDPFASMGGGVHLASGAWVPKGHPLADGPLWQDTPTPTTTAPTTTAPSTQANGTPDVTMEQAIQGLLNTSKTVNPDELAQSPENAAYRLGAQRAEERQRAQLAERAASNGTANSGGFENKLAGLRQARGEGESQFLGQLAITKMQQNREDLVNGIQFAMANGQFDKAQALQRELAQLNAAISREQIASSAATAARQIGSNETISANNLAENARQANNALGFNYANLGVNANQYLANLLLNGGG